MSIHESSAVAWCLSSRHNCSLHGQSPFIHSLPFRSNEHGCPWAPMRQPVPGRHGDGCSKTEPSFHGKLALGKTLSVLNQVKGNGVKTLNEMRKIRGLNLKHLNEKV